MKFRTSTFTFVFISMLVRQHIVFVLTDYSDEIPELQCEQE